MEKNIKHKVQPLTKKEQRLVSGGYAPTDSPIKPIDDNNGMPNFEIPGKKISNSINHNRNVHLTLLLIIKTF